MPNDDIDIMYPFKFRKERQAREKEDRQNNLNKMAAECGFTRRQSIFLIAIFEALYEKSDRFI
jgi:Uma2 family endonuclease